MFKDDLCASMKKEKVTSKWLSEYFDVSMKTVSNWRTGRSFPKKAMMDEICKLFNLPTDAYIEEKSINYTTGKSRKSIEFIFDNVKLKDLRLRGNWTQKQLSSVLNVSPNTFKKWEEGKSNPSLSSLREICHVFGVKEEYFKKRDKNMKKTEPIETGNELSTTSFNDILAMFKNVEDRFATMSDAINKMQSRMDSIEYNLIHKDDAIADLREQIADVSTTFVPTVKVSEAIDQNDILRAMTALILKGENS